MVIYQQQKITLINATQSCDWLVQISSSCKKKTMSGEDGTRVHCGVNPVTQSLEPYGNHKPYLAFHGLAQLAIGSFTKSQIFGKIFWLCGFSDKTFTPFLPQNAKEKFGYTQISFLLRH